MQHSRSARDRLEESISAINAAGEEASRVFLKLYLDEARDAADAADQRARYGHSLGPLDGVVISIKDLFDVAGEPTTAGSKLLRSAPPAMADAAVVRRMRRAGAVIVGKTNMTEFAFSGLGLNPHYGTPGNIFDPSRIPGGSSSGAGVSVGRKMAEIAVGSDTGGSVRIPAAFNGLVGFKPTQSRVSREGSFPLSYTLDCIGPLGTSVSQVEAADAVLSGELYRRVQSRPVSGLRLALPRGFLLGQVEDKVNRVFERALENLLKAHVRITEEHWDDLLRQPGRLQTPVGIPAAESAWVHRCAMSERPEDFDPIVAGRIRNGQSLPASDYVGILQARQALLPQLDARLKGFDALILPTVPCLPPSMAELSDEAAFHKANALILRNPSTFNFFDLPALSLPFSDTDSDIPIGIMLVGHRFGDSDLLSIGAAVERVLKG